MRLLFLAASVTGFAAVAFGAFGAHGLEGRLSPSANSLWDKATLYALVHSCAALTLALHGKTKSLAWAGAAFVVGVYLFSGGLYGLALGAPGIFGAIVPLGGISFLTGWALCSWATLRGKG